MKKQTIRPYYSEFQGYLSQAPKDSGPNDYLGDKAIWEQYNHAVDSLSTCANLNYSRFKIEPIPDDFGGFIRIATYRQKLGGLISRLHAEYFSDEPPPFSGMPSTVITQVQQQSVSVQMIVDISAKIGEALAKAKNDNEKGFLNKLKSGLGTITNVNDLLKQCMKMANDYGLSIQDLLSLWN